MKAKEFFKKQKDAHKEHCSAVNRFVEDNKDLLLRGLENELELQVLVEDCRSFFLNTSKIPAIIEHRGFFRKDEIFTIQDLDEDYKNACEIFLEKELLSRGFYKNRSGSYKEKLNE